VSRRRVFGILLLVVAVFVLLTGWATWDLAGEEAGTLGSLPVVSASELDRADEGDRVVIEGRTQQPDGSLVAPVSGAPAAWYRVEREHRWSSYNPCEPLVRNCRNWHPHHEEARPESPGTMLVRIDGSKRVVRLSMADAKDSVARLRKTDSRRNDRAPTATRKNDYEIEDEYLIKPGARVTVAGEVRGTVADRTIGRVKGFPLVYQAPRDAMVKNLRGYETSGKVLMVVGGLLVIAGAALLLRARRERRRGGSTGGATATSHRA
jgi:hypothetical protein